MASAKDTLRQTVETLSEGEALSALAYLRRLRSQSGHAALFERWAAIPELRLPENPDAVFPPVEPAKGTGIPASELLIQDRR